MATVQDYRRTDLRINSNGDPLWIVSKAVDGREVTGLKDKACVLFSFPSEGQQIIIREIAVHVTRAFTAGTTLELGYYTLATDGVETGGEATVVKEDAFVSSDDITASVTGWYYPTKGDFVESRKTGVLLSGGTLIKGAASSVPAIVLTPKVATIIAGQVRVQLLVSIIPNS